MKISFERACASLPLVAILRGITPDEVVDVCGILIEEGFRLIEIPLNSPKPLESLSRVVKSYRGRALFGAGTVLSPANVEEVYQAGGELIVAPNFDEGVAQACRERKLVYGPGVFTPTEAFAALNQGADFLKLFPAECIPPSGVKAIRAVLPQNALLFPVGGISAEKDVMKPYVEAGANGFGIGSALYRPGIRTSDLRARARNFRENYSSFS